MVSKDQIRQFVLAPSLVVGKRRIGKHNLKLALKTENRRDIVVVLKYLAGEITIQFVAADKVLIHFAGKRNYRRPFAVDQCRENVVRVFVLTGQRELHRFDVSLRELILLLSVKS